MQQQYIPQQNLKCRHPNCFQSFPDPNQLYSHELQCKQQQFQSAPNTGAQHYTPSGPQNQWQSTGPTASGFGYQAPNTLNQPQPSTYLSNQFRNSTDRQHWKPDTQAATSTQSQGYHPSQYQPQPYVDPSSHYNYNTPPLPHLTPDPRQGQNTQYQAQSSAYNKNQYPNMMERQLQQPDTLAAPMSQWQGQQPYNQWPQTQLHGAPPLYQQHQTHQPSVNLQPSQVGYKSPILRSLIGGEFGIENDGNKNWNNCFLNVCLQALWQCTAVRPYLLGQERTGVTLFNTFCDLSLKPFVTSIMDFYQQAAEKQGYNQNLELLNSNKVRAELFKFFYKQNKFVLHNGADAQEALDNILTILHATFAHNATISNFDKPEITCDHCPIHRLFFQQVYIVRQCCCGEEKKGVENVNQFFQMVFIDQLLEDYYHGQLSALQGCLMKFFQKKMAEVEEGCVNPKNNENGKEHKTRNRYSLGFEQDVYLFNLSWFYDPDRLTILKVLVSLPATFSLKDLFSGGDETVNYTIKGLICHTGNHYLSFYRRVAHLQGNQNNATAIFEATQIEWTLFNDKEVVCIGPWQNLIKYCISAVCKPTVVIYEKYHQIQHSQSHLLYDAQIQDLLNQCSDDYVPEPEQVVVNTSYSERSQNQEQMSSATQQMPSSALVVLPEFNQNTFRQIRRKYENDGFYLFKCHNCDNGIFALHIKKCLWFSKLPCKQDNDFLQAQQSLSSQDVEQNKIVNAKFTQCLAELEFAFLPFNPQKKNIKEPKAPYVLHQIQMEQPLESPTQAQPQVQPFFPRKESIEPVSPLGIPPPPSQVSPLRSEDASQNLARVPKPKYNYDIITSCESKPIDAPRIQYNTSTLLTPQNEQPNLRPQHYDDLRPSNLPQSISPPNQPIQVSFLNQDFLLSYNTSAESKPKGIYDFTNSTQSQPIQPLRICENSYPFVTPVLQQPNKRPLQNDDFKIANQSKPISLHNQPTKESSLTKDSPETKPSDYYNYRASDESRSIDIHEHSQPLPSPSEEKPLQKPPTCVYEFYGLPKSIELPNMPTLGGVIIESSILQSRIKPSQIPEAAARDEESQPQRLNQVAPMTIDQQSQEPALAKREESQKIKGSQLIQQRDDPEQQSEQLNLSHFAIKPISDSKSDRQEEQIPIHPSDVQIELGDDQDDKATDQNDDDKGEIQDQPQPKHSDYYNQRASNQSQSIAIHEQFQPLPTLSVQEPLQKPSNQHSEFQGQANSIALHKTPTPEDLVNESSIFQLQNQQIQKSVAAVKYKQVESVHQSKLPTMTSGKLSQEPTLSKIQEQISIHPSNVYNETKGYQNDKVTDLNDDDKGESQVYPLSNNTPAESKPEDNYVYRTSNKSQPILGLPICNQTQTQPTEPVVEQPNKRPLQNDDFKPSNYSESISLHDSLNKGSFPNQDQPEPKPSAYINYRASNYSQSIQLPDQSQSIAIHEHSQPLPFPSEEKPLQNPPATQNDQNESQSGQSEMVKVWQCAPCKKWMFLADICSTCKQTLKQRTFTTKKPDELITQMTKLEFQRLQNVKVQKTKAESKLAVEESKDEEVVMWKCPKCKVYMELGSKCTKCGQIQRDDLVVYVMKMDLYTNDVGHLKSMQDPVEQQQWTPQYWQCPTDSKIMRSDQVCPQCLKRIDQYTENGHSQKDLMNFRRKVVVQEKNKIEPGKWHCDKCDRNISVGLYCKVCKFDQNGIIKLDCWRCPNCWSIQDETTAKCVNKKCNQTRKQHIPIQEFSFWKCPIENLLFENGSACSKCFKTKEHYDNLKKEAQKLKQKQEARHPSECWVCYCCGNDKNPVNYNQCEITSCPNQYGSDYYTEFWMCFKCKNKNEVDDWIKDEVAECQNHKCKEKSKTIQDFIEKHKKARLSKCKNCTKKHYPQNAKDYCRPCLQSHFQCGCKYGCSQCEGYAYTRCEKCTQFKCRKGAKICRECTEREEVSGTCQICFTFRLTNGKCSDGCVQSDRRKQCSTCDRYFVGKPGELCFVCRPRNQVRNSTATYYNCGTCGVHRSEPGYCNKCKPSKTIFQQIGDYFF